MPERTLSKDSTYYTYTLVRKLSVPVAISVVYALLLGGLCAAFVFRFGMHGAYAAAAALLGIPLLHVLIARLYKRLSGALPEAWRFRLGSPWAGYLPAGYSPFRRCLRMLHQTAFLGAAIAGLLYVWFPPVYAACGLLVHTWLVLPHYAAALAFLRLKPGGLIRYGKREVSYYMP